MKERMNEVNISKKKKNVTGDYRENKKMFLKMGMRLEKKLVERHFL